MPPPGSRWCRWSLEARGLDVTPLTISRLRAAGDETGVRLLERILDDEIRHVRFGAISFRESVRPDAGGDADKPVECCW